MTPSAIRQAIQWNEEEEALVSRPTKLVEVDAAIANTAIPGPPRMPELGLTPFEPLPPMQDAFDDDIDARPSNLPSGLWGVPLTLASPSVLAGRTSRRPTAPPPRPISAHAALRRSLRPTVRAPSAELLRPSARPTSIPPVLQCVGF